MSRVSDSTPSTILARLIDSVRINRTTEVIRDGQPYLLKRRLRGRGPIIAMGNVFLKLSYSQIVMFPRAQEWQRREMDSFTLLHGPAFGCELSGQDGLFIQRLPGTSLKDLLDQGQLCRAMISAAAQEFRRCHRLVSSELNQPWSHGDPHLANVLYDTASQQARLIDFETCHVRGLEPVQRHADDLLVFLLDLLGRDRSGRWLDYAQDFLVAYGDRVVMRELSGRLHPPQGWELVLWKARTDNLPTGELYSRISRLRTRIEDLLSTAGAGAITVSALA